MADLQALKHEILVLAGYLAVGEMPTTSIAQANLHTLVARICADVNIEPLQIAAIAVVMAAALEGYG
jgi:hypothetical protein